MKQSSGSLIALAALLLVPALACGGTPKPSHYGTYLVQNGNLVELEAVEVVLTIPTEAEVHPSARVTERRPAIVYWQPNAELRYMEFLRLNQYLGQAKDPVRYEASPKGDGVLEIVPAADLEPGVYCLIQGDPMALIIPAWCFGTDY